MDESQNERQILGVKFYVGDVKGAIERISRGGLLVVPSAPSFKEIAFNASDREALIHADFAIADSAFMVAVWNFLERDNIQRISGLKYLRELLLQPDVRAPGNTFWVMAGPASAKTNLDWLETQGISVPPDCVYLAPIYGAHIDDEKLLARLQRIRVKHMVITVGGGTQERLGFYLKSRLNYLPAIHCVGAAIAFLSGDQVRIPVWADRFYLGWFFRCLSSPRRYIPRYWAASQLLPLIWRFRDRLPVQPQGL